MYTFYLIGIEENIEIVEICKNVVGEGMFTLNNYKMYCLYIDRII